jgi:hypothetical protein
LEDREGGLARFSIHVEESSLAGSEPPAYSLSGDCEGELNFNVIGNAMFCLNKHALISDTERTILGEMLPSSARADLTIADQLIVYFC